jgi:disulfide bond formation protein DsbB
MSNNIATTPGGTAAKNLWVWLAFLCAVAALAGSLALSYGLGLKACALCFYQRTFVMSLVAVLGFGLLTPAGRGANLAWLALPLAVAGLGVACFHVFLEVRGILECPTGFFGIGTAPKQSLAILVLITGFLMAGLCGQPGCVPAIGSSLVVGALLALAASTSNPPPQPAPTRPYSESERIEICRPPYRAP